MTYRGMRDWRSLYRDTLDGQCECNLEVLEREKEEGSFSLTRVARVNYDMTCDSYVARYISDSKDALPMPERIPHAEGARLRGSPHPSKAELGVATDKAEFRVSPDHPHAVVEGTAGFSVGQRVELQWTLEAGSPFGWWFGVLEDLRHHEDGRCAIATITFQHFPTNSRWYRLSFVFGDTEVRPCAFGGFTGGIRAASEADEVRWRTFFRGSPCGANQPAFRAKRKAEALVPGLTR